MQTNSRHGRPSPQTVDEAIARIRRLLGNRLEADLLACHAIGRDRSWLYAHGEDALGPEAASTLERLVAQRLEGRPIAHLCGFREFYGREFALDDRVLIPRPETELLVDLALSLPLGETARVCDVGTGSGCVALTLAAERPAWRITATDLSSEALAVAADNRRRLDLERVELIRGDLLEPLREIGVDLIVSNPPYVAENDPHLERGDLRFEPRLALAADADGLGLIERLVEGAPAALRRPGWLAIEHGHDQATAVAALLRRAGFAQIACHCDLAGIERVTLGCLPA